MREQVYVVEWFGGQGPDRHSYDRVFQSRDDAKRFIKWAAKEEKSPEDEYTVYAMVLIPKGEIE